jgi:hypothetical protein
MKRLKSRIPFSTSTTDISSQPVLRTPYSCLTYKISLARSPSSYLASSVQPAPGLCPRRESVCRVTSTNQQPPSHPCLTCYGVQRKGPVPQSSTQAPYKYSYYDDQLAALQQPVSPPAVDRSRRLPDSGYRLQVYGRTPRGRLQQPYHATGLTTP